MIRRALRYGAAAALAGAVTLAVLVTMMALVTGQRGELKDVPSTRIVDFVRLRREAEPVEKKRELPKRAGPPPKEAPPPDIQLAQPDPGSVLDIAAAMPALDASIDLGGGPGSGGASAGSDADVVPLVRVNPQYPARAMQRGIEGFVHLAFTISEAGTTKDIEVVESEPENYFEDAAVAAVRRYKYKPKVENGRPIERTGVEVVLSFKLNK
jgi:protein TonB